MRLTPKAARAGQAMAIAAALVLGGTGAARAQLSSQGGPISYSADNLEYADNDRTLVLTGNVDLLQNDARLQASKLTLYFEKGAKDPSGTNAMGSGQIQRIVATGDVHYVRPKQKARGDEAVYQASTDTVTFSGNVVISNDDNVLRGETLVLQIGSGRTTLKPADKPGERIRGVLRPHQNSSGR
jgi:lipopolysaccharide export system protein LptA